MPASPFLTLLNPALALVFSAAFFIVWRYQLRKSYLVMIALSQFCVAVGFLLQYYALPIGVSWTRMLSNVVFMAAVMCMATGLAWRYDKHPRLFLLGAIAGGGLMAVAWFMFFRPDLIGRVYSINFAIGGMLLVIALDIRSARNRTVIDKSLYAIVLANACLMFLRTIVTVKMDGGLASGSELHASLYWLVFTFSHAIVSLISVLAIIAAVASDILRDLKTEGETDLLSGLLNRRGFELATHQVLETSLRRPLPTSLIIADIDHFKSINDTFGHFIGDRVIVAFASVLTEMLGDYPVGRIGGEEFAVVVRGVDAQTAKLMAEGVRVAFSVASVPGRAFGASRRITASFGVAEWRPGETYDELLSRADAALYKAKKSGRDCVRVSSNAQSPVTAAGILKSASS